ncbi:efflux RND transporter permease subunit [Sandaracinus amylolyticus]|uniref:efflux RND transporter permease subunit n=1 Tax=Sandaracinus amylolyticus TaxID=927083 RepID=UPI001F441482|nr:efflux RND transporter permease subunit [Sandaracinus amylolyticus]UJR86846.1 Hypothetical protein I5071_89470 [Sandaracinus amylolyticus]
MWIVRLALRRPHTFAVLALLIVVAGVETIRRTPTDIFPSVDLPVVSVVWVYSGLPVPEMQQQITRSAEYAIAGNVADIRTIESQTLDGASVIKIYFHEGTDVAAATAQVTAIMQTIVRLMPPGTQPPIIVRYDASSVPVLQLGFSSDTLSEAEIFDFVNRTARQQLGSIRGSRYPVPAGGAPRQVVVDLDPDALRARGISPGDVTQAVGLQNLTLPTGTAKMGELELRVSLNSSATSIEALNDVPIARRDGRTIFVRDVAFVHDGYATQTNVARREGSRAIVLSVLKNGDASTTDIVAQVRDMIPRLQAVAPEGLEIDVVSDQSGFVTEAVHGLVVEGAIAASLTALLILVFLGSWRSTIIIATSIPLSVLVAALAMRAMGHTINVMTLGGLALAIGILVDDATVEIENVHRHRAMGKTLTRAILDGAQEIATPAFVASLSIAIVFVSLVFLEGPPRFLFLPLGLAVGLSVMASYFLSRTVVPTMMRAMLRDEAPHGHGTSPLARINGVVERAFERMRTRYGRTLAALLARPALTIGGFVIVVAGAIALVPHLGRDFFPTVDQGRIRLHVRAPAGTRIEETERIFASVESIVREVVPAHDRERILDVIGLPAPYTMAITDTTSTSTSEGEILIDLAHDRARSTDDYRRAIREEVHRRMPDVTVYFEAADIMTQILSFGIPAPIDVQVASLNRDQALAAARAIRAELSEVPGLVDVRLQQVIDAPRLHLEVDRARAMEVGLTQRDVASSVLLAVGTSGVTNPNYWTDPRTGNAYPVVVRIPERLTSSADDLSTLGLATEAGPQLVGDLAELSRRTAPVVASQVDVQPTFNVRASLQDADLASVTERIDTILARHRADLPPSVTIALRGQPASMESAFHGLGLGLLCAALIVYALMVVNFGSWVDPAIVLVAVLGSGVGIVASLWVTQTTLNVPSMMGAITSIGIATSNATLLVTFANESRAHAASSIDAALEAGRTRLRPIVMTALAMFLGMLPMSLGLGEGSEMNATLARAALGGLAGSTLTTLLIVPVVYSVVRRRAPVHEHDPDLDGPLPALRTES